MCSNEDIEALVAANATPDLIVDEVVCVQQVPVDRDDLLIAALPNGYFSADWDIFQNHALIRHLQEHHGYRLFGLGASWLGFQRDSAPSPAQANALVADLQRVYAAGTHDTCQNWLQPWPPAPHCCWATPKTSANNCPEHRSTRASAASDPLPLLICFPWWPHPETVRVVCDGLAGYPRHGWRG